MPASAPTFGLLDRVRSAPPVLRRRVLMDFVIAQLNEALGTEEGEAFHARSRFEEMGISSMQALEFKELLEQELHCSLQTTLMFDYPTPERLAGFIVDHVLGLGQAAEAAPAGARAEPPPPVAGPEEDIEERMRRKLAQYQM